MSRKEITSRNYGVYKSQERDYELMPNERKKRLEFLFSRAILGAIFPLYYYHDNWKNLNLANFESVSKYPDYSQGYVFDMRIGNGATSVDVMNQNAGYLFDRNSLSTIYYEDGIRQVSDNEYSYQIIPKDDKLEWLDKINSLCREKGVELVLFKVPAIYRQQEYQSAWSKIKSDALKELLSQRGIKFFDILYDTDETFDLSKDFRDGGQHCNYYGACKVSGCLSKYLSEDLGIQGCENERLENALKAYNAIADCAAMESELYLLTI